MGRPTSGVLMESSFLCRAKNAFHNATAKAERLLTEIKEDLKSDFGRSIPTKARSDEITEDWSVKYENEQQFQEKLYECILKLSKDPEKKFILWCKDEGDVQFKAQESKSVFEDDKDLQNLRFNYVPKKMNEHEFWKYYFMAVDRVKQSVSQEDTSADTDCNIDQDQAEFESLKKDPAEEDAYKKAMSMVVVPSSKLLRKLAAIIEVARPVDKVKDLMSLKTEKESQSGALVSGMKAMKNSLLRESKDSKTSRVEEVQACVQSLFEPDTQEKDIDACHTKLLEDIHGAPPGSFVSHLAEIMGSLRTHQKMAELWCRLILELRHRWEEGQPIPRLPVDAGPDLRYCLILQKLQVINCCIARQKRHDADLLLLDALNECAESMGSRSMADSDNFILLLKSKLAVESQEKLEPARLFAEGKEGQLLLRLGADFPAPNLRMLETGQQVYSPIMQEGPVLTEDLIEETEELVLRTGSVGAGCSQLLSDMQAFQAANPGCILEDFVRWYSPPDWKQSPILESSTGDPKHETESRGYLSARMQSHGNLWKELWASAKPIPAARQAPLFDEDLAVESTLDALQGIPPVEVFEQLFKAILGTGFAIAELSPSIKGELWSSQFLECKNFIISTCNTGMTAEELEQLCQVYEMLEIMLQYPSEDPQETKASYSCKDGDGIGTISMLAEKGSRYYTNLITNDRNTFGRPANEQKSKSEQGFNLFTRILEAKSSLFEKKPSQGHLIGEDEKKTVMPDGEWTVV